MQSSDCSRIVASTYQKTLYHYPRQQNINFHLYEKVLISRDSSILYQVRELTVESKHGVVEYNARVALLKTSHTLRLIFPTGINVNIGGCIFGALESTNTVEHLTLKHIF